VSWADADYAIRVRLVEQLHEIRCHDEARALARLPQIVDEETALLSEFAAAGMLQHLEAAVDALR
jgi:hypothetical protein